MGFFRKVMRRLMPSKARLELDQASEAIRAAAMKLGAQPPEVKARTGRIFLEASGPAVNRTSTA